jgi:hypothetical protein
MPLNAWRTNRIQYLRASVLAPNPGRVIITGTLDDRRQANWDALSLALWMLAGLAHGDGVQKLDQINVFGHYETAVGTSDAASSGYITPQLIVDRPCLVRRRRRPLCSPCLRRHAFVGGQRPGGRASRAGS